MRSSYAFILFALLSSTQAFATPAFVPPNFVDQGRNVVFADFKTVNYRIELDRKERVARVETEIQYDQSDTGGTVFDLVAAPDEIYLDGVKTTQRLLKTPGGETKIRIVDENVAPGPHTLIIRNRIRESLRFPILGGVNLFFRIRDLADRRFLEQYIPSTLEYDQYKATIDLDLKVALPKHHVILANGTVTTLSTQSGHGLYRIEYPSYFTSSSMFFHVFPRRTYRLKVFSYMTGSGRKIPITLYGSKIRMLYQGRKFEKTIQEVLAELEKDYGEFAHPQIFIYAKSKSGGMEHSGGAETSLVSLDHELFHSYYAKGVMPANGSSGFLDEAMASWRDYGYFKSKSVGFELSNVGNHGPYTRKTDSRSYKLGRKFFSYVDSVLDPVGGYKKFMRDFFSANVHEVITVEYFRDSLNQWSGMDFTEDFDRYILGKYGAGNAEGMSGKTFIESDVDPREKQIDSGLEFI